MSDDTRPTPGLGELGSDVEIRRYRFGFRHGIALLAVVVLCLTVASATFILIDLRTKTDPIASQWRPGQPPVAQDFDKLVRTPADLQAHARQAEERTRTAIRHAAAKAKRIRDEGVVTKAFAGLNYNDRRQVRKFLAAYKSNPYANELGYIAAVQRAVFEQRLFRLKDTIACGKCWCWREPPVFPNDTTETQ